MGQKQAEKQELLWSPPLASPAGCSWLWLRNKLINEPANGGWGRAGSPARQGGWVPQGWVHSAAPCRVSC